MDLNVMLTAFGTYGPMGVMLGVFIYWHNKNLIHTQNEYKQPVQAILEELVRVAEEYKHLKEELSVAREKILAKCTDAEHHSSISLEMSQKTNEMMSIQIELIKKYQTDVDKLISVYEEKKNER